MAGDAISGAMRVPAPLLFAPALLVAAGGIGLRIRDTAALTEAVSAWEIAERDLRVSEALADAIHREVVTMAGASVMCALVMGYAVFAVFRKGLRQSPGHMRMLPFGSATLGLAFASHAAWLYSVEAGHLAFVDHDVEGLHAAAALGNLAPTVGAVAVGATGLLALLSLVGARLDLRGAAGAALVLLALVPMAGLETYGWRVHETLLVEHHRGWALEDLKGVQLPEGPSAPIPAPRADWLVVDGSLPARELPDSGWILTASGRADHPLEQLLMLGGVAVEPAPGDATWFVVDADEVEIRVEGQTPTSTAWLTRAGSGRRAAANPETTAGSTGA